MTVVAPKQQFFCNGEVAMWRYQAIVSSGFQAIVFRPVNSDHTQYMVVGINNIPAGEINTPVTYNVPQGDRIRVQRGDVIGWSDGIGVLTYNHRPDSDLRNLLLWMKRSQFPALHDVIYFNNDEHFECSIEATFQVSINFKMFFFSFFFLFLSNWFDISTIEYFINCDILIKIETCDSLMDSFETQRCCDKVKWSTQLSIPLISGPLK